MLAMATTTTALIRRRQLHTPPPQRHPRIPDDTLTSTRSPRTGDATDHPWHRDSSVGCDETELRIGSRHLSASGRVWTVRRLLPRSDRFLLEASTADGKVAAVMDRTALGQMQAVEGA